MVNILRIQGASWLPSGTSLNADLADSSPPGDFTTTTTLFETSSSSSTMLVSLTVGKVDAGVAVLLTQDNRLVS